MRCSRTAAAAIIYLTLMAVDVASAFAPIIPTYGIYPNCPIRDVHAGLRSDNSPLVTMSKQ
jgi:hypothetical protein